MNEIELRTPDYEWWQESSTSVRSNMETHDALAAAFDKCVKRIEPDRSMNKALESLGVSKAAAGRYFGVHRNTVACWCTRGAPKAVMMVLDDMVDDLQYAEAEVHFATERIRGLRDA